MCIRRQEMPVCGIQQKVETQLGREGKYPQVQQKTAPHSSTPPDRGVFRFGPRLDYDSYRNDRPVPVP